MRVSCPTFSLTVQGDQYFTDFDQDQQRRELTGIVATRIRLTGFRVGQLGRRRDELPRQLRVRASDPTYFQRPLAHVL